MKHIAVKFTQKTDLQKSSWMNDQHNLFKNEWETSQWVLHEGQHYNV